MANPINMGGQDCQMKENDGLLSVEKEVTSSWRSNVTRNLTPGRNNRTTSQTTPSRKLGTIMKMTNNNRKKVTKMNKMEKDDIRRTTSDIRRFFEGKTVSAQTTTRDTTTMSGTTRKVDRMKLKDPMTTNSFEVSPSKTKNNPIVPRYVMGCSSRLQDDEKVSGRRREPGGADIGAGGAPRRGGAGTDDGFTEGCVRQGGRGVSVKNSMCVYEQQQRDVGCVMQGWTSSLDKSLDTSKLDDVYLIPATSIHGEGVDEGGGDGGEENRVPGDGEEKSPQKTKPKRVGGGGLSAKIHLWEMKTGVFNDENYEGRAAESSSAGTNSRRIFNNRKWNTAPLGKHGQN